MEGELIGECGCYGLRTGGSVRLVVLAPVDVRVIRAGLNRFGFDWGF